MPFWSDPIETVLAGLSASQGGLTGSEAERRRRQFGPNRTSGTRTTAPLRLLLNQFRSPLVLLLLFAMALSLFLGETADGVIVLTVILGSTLLGFWQEYRASNAVASLLAMVKTKVTVLRDGQECELPHDALVPGDVIVLAAGVAVPADCRIAWSIDLFVDESTLTGESYPAEKNAGDVAADAPLAQRSNALFQGSHVVSGTGRAVVVQTGGRTIFGDIAERLRLRPPETEFERGLRRFGGLLIQITLVLVIAIFGINVYLDRPVLDSFLFALALAVGLTPELLPAIVSLTLARGAQQMAVCRVIVRRLNSIEDFGSMNVLCSDKTGTLTEGVVRVHAALDVDGNPSSEVLLYAQLNATFESGFPNPIDEALRAANIRVIEDAAQSLGSFNGGRHLGTLGDCGVLSFSSQKLVTTGQGGAVITNDEEISRRMRMRRDFGRLSGGSDQYIEVGWNLKFTDLQAVIGVEQMRRLPAMVARKRHLFGSYRQRLEGIRGLRVPATDLAAVTPWFVDVLVEGSARSALGSFLRDRGIGSREFYPALHTTPALRSEASCPVAETVAQQGLWLPSSLRLEEPDVERVCSAIAEFFGIGQNA